MLDETSFAPSFTGQVLLVDDNAFHRNGAAQFLIDEGFEVIAVGDELSAWQAACEQALAAAIVDISIPPDPQTPSRIEYSYGLRLTTNLKARWPQLGVVLFSAYEDRGAEVQRQIDAGVRGLAYKLKGCSPQALLEALRDVMAGRVLLDPEVANPLTLADRFQARLTPAEAVWIERLIAQFDQLSAREKEVAFRWAASYSIDGIAQALNITSRTVQNHLDHIRDKLGLRELPFDLNPHVLLSKACLLIDLWSGGRRW